MRLALGMSVAEADEILRRLQREWARVLWYPDQMRAYLDTAYLSYTGFRQTVASPDLAARVQSPEFWRLLAVARARAEDPEFDTAVGARRAEDQMLWAEVEVQMEVVKFARFGLETLKTLADRPGLPVVYDTNMLNHWRQPGDVLWRRVLKDQGEDTRLCRLVIPLRVIDELDRQKYGQGDLAKKAATAIRYLERVLRGATPGEPVRLRDGATLEIWIDTDDRGSDPDLAILQCAADLDNLYQSTGARVLTDDLGMRLRANQMGLKVLSLPEDHRKRGTALDEVPKQ